METSALNNNSYIYLDNAATTPVHPEVLKEMMPFLMTEYGNASAVYNLGQEARKAIENARVQLSTVLNCSPQEIYFTSGGTESDNWVLNSVFNEYRKHATPHIITSMIEHHAILNTCRYLETKGAQITYIRPDADGIISAEAVESAIRDNTCLISIMTANNEIGTIEPIYEIGETAGKHHILFHTDAVQAFGHERIDVRKMNIDYLSASSHKLNGPKGIGFLYMKKGKSLKPFMYGGAQEKNRRAGTENTAAIVGFGKASEISARSMQDANQKMRIVQKALFERLVNEIPLCRINGTLESRLANNINVAFKGVEGEQLVMRLNEKGIYAGSGSACASGSMNPSHVLKAIGLSHEDAFGGLRLSISPDITLDQVDLIVGTIAECVKDLRGE